MDTPKVAVIMIFLNAAKFMDEAIKSIIEQTCDQWELFLVDDGSTDRSTAIARQYVKDYPGKMFYREHPNHQNRGMSASRNLGIRSSTGKYVAFLDADDVWLPHKLRDQVDIMESHPEVAMVCGRTQWWYSWSGKEEDRGRDFLQRFDLPLNSVVIPPALLLLYLNDWGASLCDVMVLRRVVEEVGGYEDAFRHMYEDQVFHAKISLQYPVYMADRCWYRYRQHPDSCCSVGVRTGRYHVQRFAFYRWLDKYSSNVRFANAQLKTVVRRELWRYRHPLLARFGDHFPGLRDAARELALLIAQWKTPTVRHEL